MDCVRLDRARPASLRHRSDRDGADVALLEALWRESGDPYIEHHPLWATLTAEVAGSCSHTFTTGARAQLDSYAFVREERGTLSWFVGEVRIHWRPTERLHLIAGQVFAPGLAADEKRDRARQLLGWLAAEARGRPVFLQSLPVDSPLIDIIGSRNNPFWVVLHGARQLHFAIDLPDSTDEFYKGLGYKTRKSTRYSVRKLEKELKGQIFLQMFSAPHQVSDFLRHAIPISQSTYQFRLLNSGLNNRTKLAEQFESMAQAGWWRGYILYCSKEPVAFTYGYRLGSTFYYWDVGYQPSWGQWSVGTVATLKLIESLIGSDDRASRLDFLYGGHDYKRRLSNRYWEEQSVYLFPKSIKNFLISQTLQLTNSVSDKAGRVLERCHLRSRVKRFFRRRAVAGR